jgi:mono/diheme cytochrome c family protein
MNRHDSAHAAVRAFSIRALRRVFIALGLGVGVTGCDNMKHQPNSRDTAGAAHATLATAAPAQAPAHTVARGAPAPGDPAFTGFSDGRALEKNPRPITPALLARGQERFNIYCAVCHGEDGYAQGIVVRRGFPAPPSYHDERLRRVGDGHLFDVMTRGYGVMLPFADKLTPDDRWAVVAYIRALQRSQHSALRDLSPADRAHFSQP